MNRRRVIGGLILLIWGGSGVAHAQEMEPAFFATYTQHLEEKNDIEVEVATTTGLPREDHATYTAPWIELEYGVRSWWTSGLYLEGVTAGRDGRGFTGWRWENRVRPLTAEHAINPVLYVEYEHVSEASRIQQEVVGTGPLAYEPIADVNSTRANELEGKIILSSTIHRWNVAENLTAEKNLSESEGVEFGYSVGAERPFARPFTAGIEAYGGLGTTQTSGLADTRQYVAPVLAWRAAPRVSVRFSTAFGLTPASDRLLLRVGGSFELR